MSGVGKGLYKLFTTPRGSNYQGVNPQLSNELKDALGRGAQDIQTERIKELESTGISGDRERWRNMMEETREQIRHKTAERDKLENDGADEGDIQKVSKEIADLEEKHRKQREQFDRTVQTESGLLSKVREEVDQQADKLNALEDEEQQDDEPASCALAGFKRW